MGNCKSTSSVAERAHEKGVLATIDLGATLEADGVCVPEGVGAGATAASTGRELTR